MQNVEKTDFNNTTLILSYLLLDIFIIGVVTLFLVSVISFIGKHVTKNRSWGEPAVLCIQGMCLIMIGIGVVGFIYNLLH